MTAHEGSREPEDQRSLLLLRMADRLHEAAMDPLQRERLLLLSAADVATELSVVLSRSEFACLAGLLESAKSLSLTLTAWQARRDAGAIGVAASGVGVLSVAKSGHASAANQAAEHLLHRLSPTGRARLDQAVRQLLGFRHEHTDPGERPRIELDPGVAVDLWRMSTTSSDPLAVADENAVLVGVVLVLDAAPSAGTIARVLGVTAAEARLCAWLARGHSLGRASAAAGIKISTARSQLGSVFRKTGTRRQPELMRLLATLPRS